MASHLTIAVASRRAFEVLHDSKALERALEGGYTRIDPFYIAAQAQVPVLMRPMEKLLGAFLRTEGPGILLNVDRPAGLIHMTCAHELGHYFMGHEDTADESIYYGDTASRHEQEADWFAYQLLTPRRLIARILKSKGWALESLVDAHIVYQLSLRLGVSYTAMVWSLARQELIKPITRKVLLAIQPAMLKRELLAGMPAEDNIRRDVWLIDERDRETVLEPRLNDILVARLQSHTTSGYLWGLDEARAEGFRIEAVTKSTTPRMESATFGDATHREYRIRNILAEEGDMRRRPLVLSERRPWLPKDAIAVLELGYAPEVIAPGLTLAARQSMLQRLAPT